MKKGWVRLYRQIEEWPLYFSEPFTKGQAWIDLFMLANHSNNLINIRGNLIEIKRGQIGWSECSLSERWKWSRGKVRRYIKLLKQYNSIEYQKNAILSVITIINYDKYQPDGTTDGTTDGHQTVQQTVQQTDTNKNDKNGKNDKNIITKVIEQAPKQKNDLPKKDKRDPAIDQILSALKSLVGVDDFADSQRWQRIYGKLCLDLSRKLGKEEFRRRLTIIKKDSFKYKRCNEIRYLYEQVKAFLEPVSPIAS